MGNEASVKSHPEDREHNFRCSGIAREREEDRKAFDQQHGQSKRKVNGTIESTAPQCAKCTHRSMKETSAPVPGIDES